MFYGSGWTSADSASTRTYLTELPGYVRRSKTPRASRRCGFVEREHQTRDQFGNWSGAGNVYNAAGQ